MIVQMLLDHRYWLYHLAISYRPFQRQGWSTERSLITFPLLHGSQAISHIATWTSELDMTASELIISQLLARLTHVSMQDWRLIRHEDAYCCSLLHSQ